MPLLLLGLALGLLLVIAALWLVLPHGPGLIALLALVVLVGGGYGLWRILSLDQFNRSP